MEESIESATSTASDTPRTSSTVELMMPLAVRGRWLLSDFLTASDATKLMGLMLHVS